jgi:1-acyl-sn-glycerol-3-phosphate acyltransferase
MSRLTSSASNLVELPRRAAGATGRVVVDAGRSAGNAVVAPLRPLVPARSVDDWGRDEHLIAALRPLARLRWRVSVGGDQRLPARGGALLVTNDRRMSFSPLYVSWALAEATGRPVRFVGRPDIAPIGPLLQRAGALLTDPTEVRAALRAGELVLIATAATSHPRHAGSVEPDLVGAAVAAGVPVIPVASMSSPFSRAARAEVGPAVKLRRKRRGPLAEVELADAVQLHLQKMLDSLGGMQTGMTALDWLGEG